MHRSGRRPRPAGVGAGSLGGTGPRWLRSQGPTARKSAGAVAGAVAMAGAGAGAVAGAVAVAVAGAGQRQGQGGQG